MRPQQGAGGPRLPAFPRGMPNDIPPGLYPPMHQQPHPPDSPPTPSTTTAAPVRALNTNASTFVPTSRRRKPIVIKNEDGTELDLEALKKHSPQPPTVPIPPPSENKGSKRKRKQARLEQEKKDAEERARKEGEENKGKEEEEAERKEEEAKREEEEEKREQEHMRKDGEEKERLRLEEEAWNHKEEARLEEEQKKAEKEKEEKERAEREDEERRQQAALKCEEAQLQAEAQDNVESPSEDSKEPEEGEVIESGEIDTSSVPPPLEIPRRRPGPLDFNAAKRDFPASHSALATTRNIERLQDIEYPEGIRSPREDLNKDAKDGKFRYVNIDYALLSVCSRSCRYDREFLLQFMPLCGQRPPNLPPLDILGIEPLDRSTFSSTRGGSGRHRQPSSAMTSTARQSLIGLGISAKPGAAPGPLPMGQFSTPKSKLTSEERYLLSTGTRSVSVSSGPAATQFGRPAMTGTDSQGGPGANAVGSKRVRSKRGDAKKAAFSQQGPPEASSMEPCTIIDLSQPLLEPVPCYPGDPEFKMRVACSSPLTTKSVPEPGTCTETGSPDPHMVVRVHALSLGTHTGTHVDAPFHFFPSGQKLHEIPLSQFVGRAAVLDVRHLAQDRGMITWADMTRGDPGQDTLTTALSCIGPRTDGKADIVLLWTGWDVHWGTPRYFSHPYFARDVAIALCDLGAKIIGVDAFSPDETPADENAETEHGWGMHETLLGHGVLICENLKGIAELVGDVREEQTWVSLMPLSIHGADGAPIRAYGWKT